MRNTEDRTKGDLETKKSIFDRDHLITNSAYPTISDNLYDPISLYSMHFIKLDIEHNENVSKYGEVNRTFIFLFISIIIHDFVGNENIKWHWNAWYGKWYVISSMLFQWQKKKMVLVFICNTPILINKQSYRWYIYIDRIDAELSLPHNKLVRTIAIRTILADYERLTIGIIYWNNWVGKSGDTCKQIRFWSFSFVKKLQLKAFVELIIGLLFDRSKCKIVSTYFVRYGSQSIVQRQYMMRCHCHLRVL